MPINYSPLFAETPESGTSKGQRFFGDALDAVLQRRQQKALQEQQIAAHAAESKLLRDHQTLLNDADNTRAMQVAAGQRAIDQARLAQERQKMQGTAIKDTREMIRGGDFGAVQPLLQTVGMGIAPRQAEPLPQGTPQSIPLRPGLSLPTQMVTDARQNAVKDQYDIDLGDGQKAPLDATELLPEGRARRTFATLMGMARGNPGLEAQAGRTAGYVAGGLSKDELGGAQMEHEVDRQANLERDARKAAAAAARAAAKPHKPGHDSDPEFTMNGLDFKPLAQATSKQAARESNKRLAMLVKTQSAADEMKTLIAKYPGLNEKHPHWNEFSAALQGLTAIRKQITGAENVADVDRYIKTFLPGFIKAVAYGSESANRAIDLFMKDAALDWDAYRRANTMEGTERQERQNPAGGGDMSPMHRFNQRTGRQ